VLSYRSRPIGVQMDSAASDSRIRILPPIWPLYVQVRHCRQPVSEPPAKTGRKSIQNLATLTDCTMLSGHLLHTDQYFEQQSKLDRRFFRSLYHLATLLR
jgi:hypothetical protein